MKVGTDPRLPTSADIGQLKTRLYDVFRQYGVAHNQLVLAHRELEAFATGTPSSFRNRLYNGNFAINQRGYVSGTATTAANQYTLDRWRVVTLGQSVTFAASGNGNQITAPAGGVEQVIEGPNIEGGVYTISWTGTATATVNGAAITHGGQTAALPANTDVTIRFSGGTVEEAQFEVGSTATAFEQRPRGVELALCQWYCQLLDGEYIGQAISATTVLVAYPHLVSMRSGGTASLIGAGRATTAAGSSSAITGITYTVAQSSTTRLNLATTGLVAGDASLVYNQSVLIDAEIY